MKRLLLVLILSITFVGCSNDEIANEHLAQYLQSKNSKAESVIACAANNNNDLHIFFFPRFQTSNYRLYVSNQPTNKTNFSKYKRIELNSEIAIANTIRAFKLNTLHQVETWAIVTFEENNTINYSNPIRLKHNTSPTIYNASVDINTDLLQFSWTNTLGKDNTPNAIFFRVLEDANQNLIAGTYSLENTYTYLDTTNEVLTITPNNVKQLEKNTLYQFSVMGVSKDNWVNFISQKTFHIQ